MKTIEVLGLGPSLNNYDPARGHVTIGVNNIFEFYPVDHLLLMDPAESFDDHRYQVIKKSKPKFTYSQLIDWNFMPGFKKISLADPSQVGYVDTLDDFYHLPRHVDSTFTAVCLAYHFGANEIVLYGVDFSPGHHLYHYREQIVESYVRLYNALSLKSVLFWIGSDDSLLSQYLPQYPGK